MTETAERVLIIPLLADFKLHALLRVAIFIWPFAVSNLRMHVLNFWSFILLITAAKKWSQPVMVIQEFCELHSFSVKVILDMLTWS